MFFTIKIILINIIKIILFVLLLIPLSGIFFISLNVFKSYQKEVTLFMSILNVLFCLFLFLLFDSSSISYQFLQTQTQIQLQKFIFFNGFDLYLGIDSISLFFILLTTLITPLVLLSNWYSIVEKKNMYLIIVLLLELLLILVFLVLNVFYFYVFFESTLIPLFILIGLFGAKDKIRASFYLFLYTLLGSLFLLISVLYILTLVGSSDYDILSKTNFDVSTQILLFIGIFIALAVKTPVIFLNSWLLKAHVESPLGGSILLAAIVLKLSLYGVLRLLLPITPKASLVLCFVVYVIGVLTIIYASISTLRTIDIKELIAYSSVCHAAVYLLSSFSNNIQGIEGSIILGLGHGFVSSGLFISVGGVLYDRSQTRLIWVYRGLAQLMPLFSIIFFMLCLGNAGTPLSLNFIGEYLSLMGIFERFPFIGILASSSIVLSAGYTLYMFNRTVLGGSYSKLFLVNILDINKREFTLLIVLLFFTTGLGIYPCIITDGLDYNVSNLIFNS